MKILLADDEESIKTLVEMIVTEEGYDFCYAPNGEDALKTFVQEQPDLVILDVMMVKMNGFEVCAKLRKMGASVPIIILSAKGDIVDKSVGFSAGADDYVVKPFSSVELLLRIKAFLRSSTRNTSQTAVFDKTCMVVGDLEIDFKRYIVKHDGKNVDLTPTEFKLLAYMAEHQGEVFSRKQLQEYIWGENYTGELGGIAVFIRKIREKIEAEPSKPKYILTTWGVGYKFNDEC